MVRGKEEKYMKYLIILFLLIIGCSQGPRYYYQQRVEIRREVYPPQDPCYHNHYNYCYNHYPIRCFKRFGPYGVKEVPCYRHYRY